LILCCKQEPALAAGYWIRLRSFLMPAAGPVAPGASDFKRGAWFKQICDVDYAVSRAQIISGKKEDGFVTITLRIAGWLFLPRTSCSG